MGKSPGPSNRHPTDPRPQPRHRYPYNSNPNSSYNRGGYAPRERVWGLNRFNNHQNEYYRGNSRPRGGNNDSYRSRYFADCAPNHTHNNNSYAEDFPSGRSRSAEGTTEPPTEVQQQRGRSARSPGKTNSNFHSFHSDYIPTSSMPSTSSFASTPSTKETRSEPRDNSRTSKEKKMPPYSHRYDGKKTPRTVRPAMNSRRRFNSHTSVDDSQFDRSPKPSTSRNSSSPALNPIELERQKSKAQLTEKLKARLELMKSGAKDDSLLSDEAEPPPQSSGEEGPSQESASAISVSKSASSSSGKEPHSQTPPTSGGTTTAAEHPYVMSEDEVGDVGFVQCSGDEALEVLSGLAVVDSVGETELPSEDNKLETELISSSPKALRPEFEKKKKQVLSNILKMDKNKLRKLMDEPDSNTSKFVLEHLVRENQAREEARKRSRIRLSSECPTLDICEVDISGFPLAIIEHVHQILLQTQLPEDDDEIQVLEAPPKIAPPCICIDFEDSQDTKHDSSTSPRDQLIPRDHVRPIPIEASVNEESLDEFGRLVASDHASETLSGLQSTAEQNSATPRRASTTSTIPNEAEDSEKDTSSSPKTCSVEETRVREAALDQSMEISTSAGDQGFTGPPVDAISVQEKEPDRQTSQVEIPSRKNQITVTVGSSSQAISEGNNEEMGSGGTLWETVSNIPTRGYDPSAQVEASLIDPSVNASTPLTSQMPSKAPSVPLNTKLQTITPKLAPNTPSQFYDGPPNVSQALPKETLLQQRLHQLSELLYEDKKTLEELASVDNQIRALMNKKTQLMRKMDFLKKRQADVLNVTPGMEFSRFQMLSSVPNAEEDSGMEYTTNISNLVSPPQLGSQFAPVSGSFGHMGSFNPYVSSRMLSQTIPLTSEAPIGPFYVPGVATVTSAATNALCNYRIPPLENETVSLPENIIAGVSSTVSSLRTTNASCTPPIATPESATGTPAPSPTTTGQREVTPNDVVRRMIQAGIPLSNAGGVAEQRTLSVLLSRLEKQGTVTIGPNRSADETTETVNSNRRKTAAGKRKQSQTENLTERQQEKKARISAIQATFTTSSTEIPLHVLSESRTGDTDGLEFKVFDKEVRYMQPRHSGAVREVLVCDTVLVTASDDKSVNIYDIKSGERKLRIGSHHGKISCVTVTPNVVDKHGGEEQVSSRRLILLTGSLDGCVRSFDLDTGELLNVKGGNPAITCLTTKWGMAYFGTETGDILSYNLKRQTVKPNKCSAEQDVIALKAAKLFEERVLIIAAKKNSVAIKELKTGFLVRTLENTLGSVYSLALCSRYIYCSDADKTVSVYDRSTGDVCRAMKAPSIVTCLTVSNPFLFCGCKDGSVKVISTQSFGQVAEYAFTISTITDITVHGDKVYAGNKAGDIGWFYAPRLVAPRPSSNQ